MKINKTSRRIGYNQKRDPLFIVWRNMLVRCYKPWSHNFHLYGARGIKVCDEWRESRKKFYEWAQANDYQEGLQIDRINNDGNYTPDNCRWTTCLINSRNRRSNVVSAETAAAIKWLALHGIEQKAIAARYGTSFKNVSNIKRGISWKEIEPILPLGAA